MIKYVILICKNCSNRWSPPDISKSSTCPKCQKVDKFEMRANHDIKLLDTANKTSNQQRILS